jgi:hypothetical protein
LQAADLISRIAPVMKKCDEEKLLAHLGVVLYENLGEEYPGACIARRVPVGLLREGRRYRTQCTDVLQLPATSDQAGRSGLSL